MRVAVLTNILPTYRVPAYQLLANTPGWQLRVMLNAESEFDRSWDVDPGDLDLEVIETISLRRSDTTLHLPSPRRLLAALGRFRPDAIVSAEFGARTLISWLYCAWRSVPLVVWAEHTRARMRAAGPLSRLLRGCLAKRAGTVVVAGAESRRTMRELGVSDDRILEAPNTHDTIVFAEVQNGLDVDAARESRRAQLGCRSQVALVAGRLFSVKGIEPLLVSWQRLPEEVRSQWTLLFVGDGPLAQAVADAVASRPAGEIVHVPAVQPRELVGFYLTSDLLIFPGLGDVWGLAVNEAMACGLPVVCSTRAGCAEDLIVAGENGWLADPLDVTAFTAALKQAMTCEHRNTLGERARTTLRPYTPEATAEGVRRAVRLAREMNGKRQPPHRGARLSA